MNLIKTSNLFDKEKKDSIFPPLQLACYEKVVVTGKMTADT